MSRGLRNHFAIVEARMSKAEPYSCWCCDRATRLTEDETLLAQDAYFECLDCYLELNSLLVSVRLQDALTRERKIESQGRKTCPST